MSDKRNGNIGITGGLLQTLSVNINSKPLTKKVKQTIIDGILEFNVVQTKVVFQLIVEYAKNDPNVNTTNVIPYHGSQDANHEISFDMENLPNKLLHILEKFISLQRSQIEEPNILDEYEKARHTSQLISTTRQDGDENEDEDESSYDESAENSNTETGSSSSKTPVKTAAKTPVKTVAKTPVKTVAKTVTKTPNKTVGKTVAKTAAKIPGKAPNKTVGKTPVKTVAKTKKRKLT